MERRLVVAICIAVSCTACGKRPSFIRYLLKVIRPGLTTAESLKKCTKRYAYQYVHQYVTICTFFLYVFNMLIDFF